MIVIDLWSILGGIAVFIVAWIVCFGIYSLYTGYRRERDAEKWRQKHGQQ